MDEGVADEPPRLVASVGVVDERRVNGRRARRAHRPVHVEGVVGEHADLLEAETVNGREGENEGRRRDGENEGRGREGENGSE